MGKEWTTDIYEGLGSVAESLSNIEKTIGKWKGRIPAIPRLNNDEEYAKRILRGYESFHEEVSAALKSGGEAAARKVVAGNWRIKNFGMFYDLPKRYESAAKDMSGEALEFMQDVGIEASREVRTAIHHLGLEIVDPKVGSACSPEYRLYFQHTISEGPPSQIYEVFEPGIRGEGIKGEQALVGAFINHESLKAALPIELVPREPDVPRPKSPQGKVAAAPVELPEMDTPGKVAPNLATESPGPTPGAGSEVAPVVKQPKPVTQSLETYADRTRRAARVFRGGSESLEPGTLRKAAESLQRPLGTPPMTGTPTMDWSGRNPEVWKVNPLGGPRVPPGGEEAGWLALEGKEIWVRDFREKQLSEFLKTIGTDVESPYTVKTGSLGVETVEEFHGSNPPGEGWKETRKDVWQRPASSADIQHHEALRRERAIQEWKDYVEKNKKRAEYKRNILKGSAPDAPMADAEIAHPEQSPVETPTPGAEHKAAPVVETETVKSPPVDTTKSGVKQGDAAKVTAGIGEDSTKRVPKTDKIKTNVSDKFDKSAPEEGYPYWARKGEGPIPGGEGTKVPPAPGPKEEGFGAGEKVPPRGARDSMGKIGKASAPPPKPPPTKSISALGKTVTDASALRFLKGSALAALAIVGASALYNHANRKRRRDLHRRDGLDLGTTASLMHRWY